MSTDRIKAIKAELYELLYHNCNGRLTLSPDGSRDPNDHGCYACDKIGKLRAELLQLIKEEEVKHG